VYGSNEQLTDVKLQFGSEVERPQLNNVYQLKRRVEKFNSFNIVDGSRHEKEMTPLHRAKMKFAEENKPSFISKETENNSFGLMAERSVKKKESLQKLNFFKSRLTNLGSESNVSDTNINAERDNEDNLESDSESSFTVTPDKCRSDVQTPLTSKSHLS
jgi:hypothetical protein